MFFFAKVEDVFEIPGKGCAVAHTYPTSLPKGECITARDYFVFRRPDGTLLRTDYNGVEVWKRDGKDSAAYILLPRRITLKDIPIGAEIWVEKT